MNTLNGKIHETDIVSENKLNTIKKQEILGKLWTIGSSVLIGSYGVSPDKSFRFWQTQSFAQSKDTLYL